MTNYDIERDKLIAEIEWLNRELASKDSEKLQYAAEMLSKCNCSHCRWQMEQYPELSPFLKADTNQPKKKDTVLDHEKYYFETFNCPWCNGTSENDNEILD